MTTTFLDPWTPIFSNLQFSDSLQNLRPSIEPDRTGVFSVPVWLPGCHMATKDAQHHPTMSPRLYSARAANHDPSQSQTVSRHPSFGVTMQPSERQDTLPKSKDCKGSRSNKLQPMIVPLLSLREAKKGGNTLREAHVNPARDSRRVNPVTKSMGSLWLSPFWAVPLPAEVE